ncbi:hypothetical protein [Roseixanthobacter pseudopolyaromaticivorans]|uniref:hypothetical protein n=1 Tax=Xanthobacteraceae TaxID=335928 RepID=UPI00372BF383
MRYSPLRIISCCIFTLLVAGVVGLFFPATLSAYIVGLTVIAMAVLVALRVFTWWRAFAILSIVQFLSIFSLEASFSFDFYFQFLILIIEAIATLAIVSYAFKITILRSFTWKIFSYFYAFVCAISAATMIYSVYDEIYRPDEVPYAVFLSLSLIVMIPYLGFIALSWLGVWRYAQTCTRAGGQTPRTEGALP